MNNLIICFVVAFCIVQIDNVHGESLEVLKARLQQSKGNVNRIINDQERSKRNLEFDLSRKLSETKINNMQAVNDMTNPGMAEIRNAAKAAKEQGKNPDNCVESGRLALREISLSSYASLDACVSDAKKGIVPSLNEMDTTIARARGLLSKLDTIFPNCYSNNILQMQSCIAIAIANANVDIRTLQSVADDVKSRANVASSGSLTIGSSCMSGVIASTRPKVPVAVNNAKACIENA